MAGLTRGVVAGAIIALLIWGLGLAQAQQPSSLIGVEEWVSPEEIYFQGSGETPDRATVNLALTALRDEPFPLDLILVVDRSASSDVTLVREIGKEILGTLSREDRVALVSFADTATLDVGLTWNRGVVEQQLDRLGNMGKTGLGEGLALANRELLENGREEAVLAEILLVDGRSNVGRDPRPQAESAARGGISIFAIGTGRYVLEADLLTEIAQITGGAFFEQYDDGVLEEILSAIYRDMVGIDIAITKTLAEGFSYEGSISNAPIGITDHNGLTILTWVLEELPVGERWRTTFEIGYATPVSERETLQIYAEPGSLSFTGFRGQLAELELDMLRLVVRPPNRPPRAEFEFFPEEPTDLEPIEFKDLSSDPDGEITSWVWDFGDGTTATEQNPVHRYDDNGLYTVKLTVQDNEGAESSKTTEIEVRNVAPEASFSYSPDRPGIGQKVAFDASESHDPDGEIAKYEWDLDGDGTFESEGSTTERVYEQTGTYLVALRATDDDGATATATQEVTVSEPAAVSREIDTYLRVDKTLPEQTFRVKVTIEAAMDLHGLGLDETIPEGWTVTPIENASATYHKGKLQWLFMEVPAGTVKQIVYDVTVPDNAELGIYDIKGNISSASPRFELAVGGEDQVEVTDQLPIGWVVSRWDTENDQFDIQLSDLITFDQIQLAIAWWLEEKTVPHTGDQVINLQVMQELVAYWLTDTPVYEPLR